MPDQIIGQVPARYGEPNATAGSIFRYTGQLLDAETGLYSYKARYYSPALGRFLQTDPIGYEDQMNLYAYTGNDPVNMTDPSGKETECVVVPGGLVCTLKGELPPPPWWPRVSLEGPVISDNFFAKLAEAFKCGAHVCPEIVSEQNSNSDKSKEGKVKDKPYAGETPDDQPGKYKNLPTRRGGRGRAKENVEDGSVWEPDNAKHGGVNGNVGQIKELGRGGINLRVSGRMVR